MNFDRLDEFVTTADKKSIKGAADALSVSPSTLHSRLSALEKSLNANLLTRNGSGVELTPAGERFYADAAQIVSDYHRLKKEIAAVDKVRYNSMRIAVAGSGLPFYLGPYLDIINSRFPSIRLDIVDDSFCPIQRGLADGLIDMYFAPVMTHISFPNIRRYPISAAQQHVILPSDHRLANHTGVSMQDLDGERFILYPESAENCVRDFQLENIKAANIRYSIYETDSSARFFKLLVPIGKGVLLTPFPMGTPPNSVSLPVNDITYPAPSSLFINAGDTRREIHHFAKNFFEFVKENSSHEHGKTV